MAPCTACASHPKGETGHAALAFYVEGPFPGRQIFKCAHCDARWVRAYGSTTERYAWSLYKDERRVGAGPKVLHKAPA
jgi:transposase-like protein